MRWARGYALLETLLALLILAAGIVSVASLFSVTASANIRNRQRTTASLLVHDKLERFQPETASPGGSLDPELPAVGFSEYITIASDGTILVDNTNTQAPYLRLWQIQSAPPAAITVAVFARVGNSALLELARATRDVRRP